MALNALLSAELLHQGHDLSCLYRQLGLRIDIYLRQKEKCTHTVFDAEHKAIYVPSIQKTIYRAMREREMRQLWKKIQAQDSQLKQAMNLFLSTPQTTFHDVESYIAENFLAVYQMIWGIDQDIEKINQHKQDLNRHLGKFALCIQDLLSLMECDLAAAEEQQTLHAREIGQHYFCLLKK